MPPDQEQPQRPAPVIVDLQRMNTPIVVTPPDDSGVRKISFAVAPLEMHTYLLAPDTQDYIVRELTGGIEIAGPGDIPTPKEG